MQTSDTDNTEAKAKKGGKLRKVIIALVGIAIAILVNVGLTYALEPYGTYAELKWYLYRELEPGSIDTLIVGSSYAQLCVWPAAVDKTLGSTSFNMGMPAQSLDNSLVVIKEAYEDHGIKRVILATSINTMIQSPWSYSAITFTQGKCQGESLPEQISNWWNLLTDPHYFGTGDSIYALVPWTVNSVKKTPAFIRRNIWNRLNCTVPEAAKWVDPKLTDAGQGYWAAEYSGNLNWIGRNVSAATYGGRSFNEGNVQAIHKIGAYCQEHGIELIVTAVPRPDFELLAYGEQYPTQMQELQDIVEQYGGLLVDVNLMHDDVYDPPETDFMDKEHVSRTGAGRFCLVLGSAIAQWEETGSIDDMMYSYDEWDEYCKSVDEICLASYSFVIEDGRIVVTAKSYQGSDIDVEYSFMYTSDFKSTDYELVRDWSDDPELIIETEGHGMTDVLWVFVRQKGTSGDDAVERYYAQQIRY